MPILARGLPHFYIVLKRNRGDCMTYEEIKDYIGKKVILTDIDGKKFRGLITNTESEFDTASGKEEIELDAGPCFYGIPIDEIKFVLEIE